MTIRDTKKNAFNLGMELRGLDMTTEEFVCIGYKVIDKELLLSNTSNDCEKFKKIYNLEETNEFAWNWWLENKDKSDEQIVDGNVTIEIGFQITNTDLEGFFCSIKSVWLEKYDDDNIQILM